MVLIKADTIFNQNRSVVKSIKYVSVSWGFLYTSLLYVILLIGAVAGYLFTIGDIETVATGTTFPLKESSIWGIGIAGWVLTAIFVMYASYSKATIAKVNTSLGLIFILLPTTIIFGLLTLSFEYYIYFLVSGLTLLAGTAKLGKTFRAEK